MDRFNNFDEGGPRAIVFSILCRYNRAQRQRREPTNAPVKTRLLFFLFTQGPGRGPTESCVGDSAGQPRTLRQRCAAGKSSPSPPASAAVEFRFRNPAPAGPALAVSALGTLRNDSLGALQGHLHDICTSGCL